MHNGSPDNCFFRGPTFINDKSIKDQAMQYNLKHGHKAPPSQLITNQNKHPVNRTLPKVNTTTDNINETQDINIDQSLDTPFHLDQMDSDINDYLYDINDFSPQVNSLSDFQIHNQQQHSSFINNDKLLRDTTTSITPSIKSKFVPKFTTDFQIDGGSNSHVVNNKSYFYQYQEKDTPIQQVSGTTSPAQGFGTVVISIPNSDFYILLWPTYYMPNNPQNTLSTTALKYYNHFRSVRMESLDWIKITSKEGKTIKVNTNKYKTTMTNWISSISMS